MRPAGEIAAFVGGFVAGEGCFTRPTPTRFRFSVHLGAVDLELCESLRCWLGVGHVNRYPRRRPHFDDEAVYAIDSAVDLVEVIVPFMDEHLPPSHKRRQYLAWRTALLDHWEHRARRPGVSRAVGS